MPLSISNFPCFFKIKCTGSGAARKEWRLNKRSPLAGVCLFYQGRGMVFKSIDHPLSMPAKHLQAFDVLYAEITEVCGFIAQAWFAVDDLHLEMQCDNVSLVAIRVDDQLVGVTVDADQVLHADAQAGLLEHFPFTGLCHRLAGLHPAARQTPLTVVCAARKKDAPLFIEECGGTSHPEFALPAQLFPIKNLCHFLIPLVHEMVHYPAKGWCL